MYVSLLYCLAPKKWQKDIEDIPDKNNTMKQNASDKTA